MFAHLHNHTQYSLLDGQSHLDRLIARARELGQEAVAMTDHGNLYGAIEFYTEAKKAGIKPIIGVEGYVAPKSRHDRDPNDRFPFHLTILAQSKTGYRNLLKLVSASHLEGFYYKPRMDRELLQQHAEGLVVLSGCPSAEVPKLIANGRLDEAAVVAQWYQELFGDNYYLELINHEGVPDLPKINDGLIDLSQRIGIPLVATNDTHYTYPEDHELQDILLCIQTNSTVDDANRMRFDSDSFYLKSEAEMAQLWPELPEALANTQRIADSCDVSIDFGRSSLPRYPTPKGESALEYLTQLCEEGLARRYPEITQPVRDRLQYELEVIEKTGFADYFLVAWEIARFARGRELLMGVRGSAAASVVLYCLGVTDIDPIETRLVFERFLNIERREMPDIDFDFQDDRRGEVIHWAAERYGEGHVAQIVTFGTLGAKAAIRDVGRALGMDFADVDRVARLIPTRLGITLDKAIEENAELAQLANSEGRYKRLIDIARGLEGTVRHASTHAAAVVITEDPLTDVVALQRATNGEEHGIPATQFSMDPVAKLGLLKMDFLGLTNLTILDRALKFVDERGGAAQAGSAASAKGHHEALLDIPLNDKNAFQLLAAGDTFGVFQLESDGMRRYIKELKPTSVADLSAMIALYRPGPMEHIPTFIDAKHGLKEITYPHPDLKNILEETYGVIVYQDQVLLIAREFGGYTLGEADILRKAMGKKVAEVMAAEREKFINGALEKGYSKDLAINVFELIEPFAGYAFNKAHSACYAMIAYWTAYLKGNYAVEYMTALLDAASGNPERLSAAVREVKRLGIPLYLPDVNEGEVGFSVANLPDGTKGIRFGLASIKGVGHAAVQPIVDERVENGPYKSIEDLCRRVKFKQVSARLFESLIKVGALDCLASRAALLDSIDRIVALAQQEQKLRESGQVTMFDLLGEQVHTPMPQIDLVEGDQINERERLLWENELLGAEVTESAFTREMRANAERFTVSSADVTEEMGGHKVGLLGQIRGIRNLTTRNNDPFLVVNLGLLDGEVEVMVWPRMLESTRNLWEPGKFVTVMGSVRVRDGRVSVSADEAAEYDLHAHQPMNGSSNGVAHATSSNGAGVPSPARSAPSSNGTANHAALDAKKGSYYSGVAPAPVESRSSTNGYSNGHGSAAALDEAWTVRICETPESLEDRYRLEDLVKILLEYRGATRVTLEILTGNRVVAMEMPFINVQPCNELAERVEQLLGSGSVKASA